MRSISKNSASGIRKIPPPITASDKDISEDKSDCDDVFVNSKVVIPYFEETWLIFIRKTLLNCTSQHKTLITLGVEYFLIVFNTEKKERKTHTQW